jgi:hypothetical protein
MKTISPGLLQDLHHYALALMGNKTGPSATSLPAACLSCGKALGLFFP